MPTITLISEPSDWFLRERPSSVKFNAEIVNKINSLIGNHEDIDQYLRILIQGSIGGSEQGKIPFALPSAPTGWTRDILVSSDTIMSVSSSGGIVSGTWTVSGLSSSSEDAHTHSLSSHTHSYDHTHTSVAHSHTMDHSHTFSHRHAAPSEAVVTTGANASTDPHYMGVTRSTPLIPPRIANISVPGHTHTYTHTHEMNNFNGAPVLPMTGSTTESSAGVSSVTGTSGTSSPDTTSSVGTHNHTLSHDGAWRPKYLNMIICRKD